MSLCSSSVANSPARSDFPLCPSSILCLTAAVTFASAFWSSLCTWPAPRLRLASLTRGRINLRAFSICLRRSRRETRGSPSSSIRRRTSLGDSSPGRASRFQSNRASLWKVIVPCLLLVTPNTSSRSVGKSTSTVHHRSLESSPLIQESSSITSRCARIRDTPIFWPACLPHGVLPESHPAYASGQVASELEGSRT